MPDDELEQPCGRRGRLLHGTLERAAEVPNAYQLAGHVAGTPDAHFTYFHVHVEAPSSLRTRAPLSTSGSKLVALTATVP